MEGLGGALGRSEEVSESRAVANYLSRTRIAEWSWRFLSWTLRSEGKVCPCSVGERLGADDSHEVNL
jgi:hypothetical protein